MTENVSTPADGTDVPPMTEADAPTTVESADDNAGTPPADETAESADDTTTATEPEHAVFKAATDTPVPVPTDVSTEPVPTLYNGDVSSVRDVPDDVSGLLGEIHRMVSDLHALVTDVEPPLRAFVSQMEKGGIGSLFGSMFGGRK
jgi:hypothetical protein